MNRIYKVVWCHVRNIYVVASELASRKKLSSTTRATNIVAVVAATTMLSVSGFAVAATQKLGNGTIAINDSVQSLETGESYKEAKIVDDSPGSIAIGKGSVAGAAGGNVSSALAIGVGAQAVNTQTIAIGSTSKASGSFAVAVGPNANASGSQGVAIGNLSKSTGNFSVALGTNANAEGTRTIALGDSSKATNLYSMALGVRANSTGQDSIAFGRDTVAEGPGSIVLGLSSKATGNDSIAIGVSTKSDGRNAIVLGKNATANGANAFSMGTDSQAIGDHTTALGVDAKALGLKSTALGNAAAANGEGAVAIGDGANAKHDSSVAIGANSVTSGANQVSFGNDTIKRKLVNVAAGDVSANSFEAVNGSQLNASNLRIADLEAGTHGLLLFNKDQNQVLLNSTLVSNDFSLILGANAKAATLDEQGNPIANAMGSIVLGNGAISGNNNAIAMGTDSQALGYDSLALGSYSVAGGDNAVAIGHQANAAGSHAFALGIAANASGADSTAIGNDAKASATNAVAIGNGAEVSNGARGSVAIGSNSKTQYEESYIKIGPNEYLTQQQLQEKLAQDPVFALEYQAYVKDNGMTEVSEVAFGFSEIDPDSGEKYTHTRRLTGVAEGQITEDSTEAVNGSQLYLANKTTAEALGGGATIGADGSISMPDYATALKVSDGSKVEGVEAGFEYVGTTLETHGKQIANNTKNITTIGERVTVNESNITKIQGDISSITSGAAGLVLLGKDEQSTQIVLDNTKAADRTVFNIGNGTENRTLTGVANGVADNDAVNLSQLKVVDKKADDNAKNIADNTKNITTIEGDVKNIGDRVTVNEGSISSIGDRVTVNEGSITDIKGDITSIQGDINNISSGTAGVVIVKDGKDAEGNDIKELGINDAIAGADGARLNLANKDGSARTLTGVANGVADNDAVNFSQLKVVDKKADDNAKNIADNTKNITTIEGNITTIGENITTIQSDVKNIDGRVTVNEENIKTIQTDITNISSGAAGVVIVKDGKDADGNDIKEIGINDGIAGADGARLNLANKDGSARTLTGVANGVADNDAVNLSQLKVVDKKADDNAKNIADNTKNITTIEGDVKNIGDRVTVNEGSILSIGDRVTVNEGSITDIKGDITSIQGDINNISSGTAGVVIVKDGKDAEGNDIKELGINDAIAGADGARLNLSNKDGSARTLTGVANGVADNDAVNLSQLKVVDKKADDNAKNITTIEGNITTIGENITTIQSDVKNIDGRVIVNEENIKTIQTDITNISSGAAGVVIVKDGKDADGNDIKEIGINDGIAGADGARLNLANKDGSDRTLTGVANGVADNDAVNLSQLKVVDKKADDNAKNIADNTKNITTIEGNITTIGDNITKIGDRVTVNEGNITKIGDRVTVNEGSITDIKGDITSIQGDITNISKGAAGVVIVKDGKDAEGNDIKELGINDAIAGADGARLNLANKDGSARTLTGVANGVADNDAVNFSQLKVVDKKADDNAKNIADNTKNITTIEGNITTIGENITTIQSDVKNIDGRVTVNEENIKTIQTDITNISKGAAGVVIVKDGKDAEGNDIKEIGINDEIAGADGARLNLANKDGSARTLTGVANGVADNDAVNFSQLKVVDKKADDNAKNIADNTTNISKIEGNITTIGDNITKIGDRVTVNEGNITKIGDRVTVNEGSITDIKGDITSIQGDITNISKGTAGVVIVKDGKDADGNDIKEIGINDEIAGADGARLNLANKDGSARTLTGVANGVADNDAVNFSQLKVVDKKADDNAKNIADNTTNISKIEGNITTIGDNITKIGDRVTVNEGNITKIGDRVTVNEGSITDIKGDITSIQGDITNISKGTAGVVIVKDGKDADGNDIKEIGINDEIAGADGARLNLANKDGSARTLTGVANGVADNDAVNFSQLKVVDKKADDNAKDIADNAKNIRDVDGAVNVINNNLTKVEKSVGDNLTKITHQGKTLEGVKEALGGNATIGADGMLSMPDYTAALKVNDGSKVEGVEAGFKYVGTTLEKQGKLISDNTTNITKIQTDITNISSGAAGVVIVKDTKDAEGNDIKELGINDAIAGADGAIFNFSNRNGSTRILTGITNGRLSATSTDAVNGSQLFTTNNNVNNIAGSLGGGAGIGADGQYTGPNYKDALGADKDLNSVNDGFAFVGDKLSNHEDRINSIEDNITGISNGSSGLVQLGKDKDGNQSLVIDNNLAKDVGVFDIGNKVVQLDDQGNEMKDANGNTIYEKDEDRTLTGVKDGNIEKGSSDAINGGQFAGSLDSIASIFGPNAKVLPDGTVQTPKFDVGQGFDNISDSLKYLDGKVGNINEGLFVMAKDDEGNDVVQLGESADSAKSVSFANSTGDNRVLTGVGVGKVSADSTDAINGSQLHEVKEQVTYNTSAIDHINSTLGHYNTRISNLEKTVYENRKRASAGTASAMAMSSIPYIDHAKHSFGMGVASYDGEAAMSIGVEFKIGHNGRFRIQGSYDTQKKAGVGAGVAFEF